MIARTVVQRPITIAIVFSLLVGLGLYSMSNLAVDLLPEINPPILVVTTNYRGAGPEEVEAVVTRTIEGVLNNVSNIETITSTSTEGNSLVQVTFVYGTDMNEASNEVRDVLELAKAQLPADVDKPLLFKFDPSLLPILQLGVQGKRPPEELREIAERVIQPRLEQVEGVALANVSGGRVRAVLVEVPQNRLEAYDLTLSQISQVLRGQNVQISAGSISEGNTNFLIQTSGQFKTLDDLRNTVVAYRGAPPSPQNPAGSLRGIRLGDLASVTQGYRASEGLVRVNGEPGVTISIQKQSGTNSVATAEAVSARLERIRRELPPDIQVQAISDNTQVIRSSLSQVTDSALSGAYLAVIILLIFLRSFKSTLIIGVAIPISIIVTLAAMYFFNLTLNVMTLAGLALGIGMLVDNSIVILENIFRYREKGTKLQPAAILGTTEMITAILASTLTTLMVFAPLLMFQNTLGFVGEIFSGLTFTIVISLSASLVVALVLVPVLSSKFFPLYTKTQRPQPRWFQPVDDVLEGFFKGMERAYTRALAWVLRHKLITLGGISLVAFGSFAAIPVIGLQFLPSFGQDSVVINAELPIGTRLEATEDLMFQLEEIARREIQGYKNLILNAGGRGTFGLAGVRTNRGSLTITLPPFEERIDSFETVQAKMRPYFDDFPSAVISFGSSGNIGGGSPIDILVKSEDLNLSADVAVRIRDLIKANVPEATEPTADLRQGRPQVEVVIDRDRAYALGLNLASIGSELRANVDGLNSGRMRQDGREQDIVVILDPRDRVQTTDLDRVFVLSPSAGRIPLASVARQERTTGPIDIQRNNQTRTLRVRAGLKPGTPLDRTVARIQDLIRAEIPADDRVVIEFGGDFENLIKYGTQFVIILLISVLLVYGVMAAQFESFLDPFLILFTIPLTVIGVVAVYALSGQTFSVFTAAGLVILVGIVVNNGIVLVDYTNTLRKRGRPLTEAVIEAGGHRLRPILMTTLTTILGLLPVAFFSGTGTDLIKPIAQTLVGGLGASTLLTLFFVPALYAVFNKGRERRELLRREKARAALDQELHAEASHES